MTKDKGQMDYTRLSDEELQQLINKKDGDAICELGERCMYGTQGHEINLTRAYQLFHKGEKMGLAFQILDDVLDVTGTEETIGKPVFSDEKNEKTTYVTLFGVEKSIAIAKELSQAAIAQLEESGYVTEFLVKMIQNLACRTF